MKQVAISVYTLSELKTFASAGDCTDAVKAYKQALLYVSDVYLYKNNDSVFFDAAIKRIKTWLSIDVKEENIAFTISGHKDDFVKIVPRPGQTAQIFTISPMHRFNSKDIRITLSMFGVKVSITDFVRAFGIDADFDAFETHINYDFKMAESELIELGRSTLLFSVKELFNFAYEKEFHFTAEGNFYKE